MYRGKKLLPSSTICTLSQSLNNYDLSVGDINSKHSSYDTKTNRAFSKKQIDIWRSELYLEGKNKTHTKGTIPSHFENLKCKKQAI